MGYIDAFYDKNTDQIHVAERVDGQLITKVAPAEHVFYYEHAAGNYRTIFGDACKKFSTNDKKKFNIEVAKRTKPRAGPPTKIFEHDIDPVFRFLADNYKDVDAPVLNTAFFDIETAFDPERGFAPTDDPFNEITAITTHQSWTGDLITVALRPPTMTLDEAKKIGEKYENTTIFDDEREMLEAFLDTIDDADVISGFNSEGYDIPYLINRMKMLFKASVVNRLCLFGQKPKPRKYSKFGKEFNTYELIGRVHLDYLLLYQKHNPQKLHSYRLDFVGEIEVGENKVHYEGSLDQLYKQDFDKFVAYSRQDVALLAKIDAKRKYIELANQVAHANYVTLKTTMGSVNLVDQAIINEMHDMGFIVPSKTRKVEVEDEEEVEKDPVVGAYVAQPKAGLHEHIACIDLSSLYPSVIRSLNMSPETIVGQLSLDETMALVQSRIDEGWDRAEAWDGIFHTLEFGHVMDADDAVVEGRFDDGRVLRMTGAEWNDYIFDPKRNLCMSANGTIFRTDKEGMIPALLAKWYADRKTMQKKQGDFMKLADGWELPVDLTEALSDLESN
jgi:DNA polymerase elongation subunit (family B)